MKKLGIIIFGAAIIVGIVISNFFSFGKASGDLLNFSFKSGVRGSGNAAAESRDASGFTAVEVGGVFQVEIVNQKDFSVEVEADDNLLTFVKTEVDGDTLKIYSEESMNTRSPVRVRIGAPNIAKLDASGASKVSMSNIKNESLVLGLSGASKVSLSGETGRLNVEASGASSVDAAKLNSQAAEIEASGASNVTVAAAESLKLDASGASRINYTGNPKNVEKHSSGASSISQK